MPSEADILNAHRAPDHTEPIRAHLDQWHQHESAEGMPREEHTAHANVPALLASFVVITLGTLIFSIIVAIYTIGQVNEFKKAGEVQALPAVTEAAREYERAALAAQEGYGWTDSGRVRLPIERAMQIVAAEAEGQEGR